MAEPFVAEIRIFAGNFAPRSWAFCDGQILSIAQNTALFSLLGTTFGGDGRTSFGLPNLQGRAPMHPGSGPGLTTRRWGERGGVETVTLTANQMPAHTHSLQAANVPAQTGDPAGASLAPTSFDLYGSTGGGSSVMAGESLSSYGGGGSHNNMQPYLALNFIIALVGLYPSRA